MLNNNSYKLKGSRNATTTINSKEDLKDIVRSPTIMSSASFRVIPEIVVGN